MIPCPPMKALCSALGLALVAASLAVPSIGRAEPPNYTVDVSKSTTAVEVGRSGRLAVHIQPAEGYKVNEKGPLGLKLSAPEALALEKAALGRADAQGETTSPEFACGFDAKAPGEQPITVEATFILCDTAGTICEMKREKVEVAVVVK